MICPRCGVPVTKVFAPGYKPLMLDLDPLPSDAPGGWVVVGIVGHRFDPRRDSCWAVRYREHEERCQSSAHARAS
jgi:hypothetical protein